MIFTSTYPSLIGNLTIAVQDDKLIGIWIENQKYEKQNIKEEMITAENNQTIKKTKDWLDQYFAKKRPNIKELDLKPMGSTFRKAVWDILTEIPYGTVTTYKDVTIKVAKKLKVDKMSAQAVGAAIAHNPISIIIPCHRVIGTNKKLTGYAGGLDKKLFLLEHEQVDKKSINARKKHNEKVLNEELIYMILSVVEEISNGKVATSEVVIYNFQ